MRIDIATLFPEMCESVLSESIIGRARKAGKIEIHCHQIRDYTLDKHRRVDDTPYGGGMGMVMQAEPVYRCWQAVCEMLPERPHTIYLSPKGSTFNQAKAVELSHRPYIFLLCGHYEGIDQRVLDKIVDEEISAGDYVLTGGELPALIVADAVARMCDGVLPSAECYEEESHFGGLLEYPHYTRPEVWEGAEVPPVLLTGHHKNIAEYRHAEALRITAERRPDMYERYIELHPPKPPKRRRRRHSSEENNE
ncbi:MAG: tRNA (guanosine(37)-N1)-methyltransferase TrmD [Oscillospiraceae bacterium]|nr:tRNA (guanosine(37)-N1)-methyltransferase TrmD [Oscillospiraceae bacterium]